MKVICIMKKNTKIGLKNKGDVMEIEDKYLKLLNLLVHDKRTKQNGMICSLEINGLIGGYGLSYRTMFDHCNVYRDIFFEDFEKGNVIFLIPFGIGYREKEFAKLGEIYKQRIKEFFGDKFREDMLMEINEEERQREIREWEKSRDTIFNWDRKFAHDNNKTG